MEKQKVCKICSKRFPNGKAMGGHMRSHSSKLPLPPNSKSMSTPIPISRSDHQCSSSSYLDDDDTDSPSRLPLKRLRRDSQVSTEDVALCLLMMSRDGRKREEESKNKESQNDFVSDLEEDDEDEEEDSVIWKFKCKMCKKAFRSYQALGGHNASHRRSMNNNNNINAGSAEAHRKIFECSLCPKVFDSGQALGGHKKVHLSISNNHVNNSHSPRFSKTPIDLNRRPASPYDSDSDYDDEDEKVSQVESSEISNPF